MCLVKAMYLSVQGTNAWNNTVKTLKTPRLQHLVPGRSILFLLKQTFSGSFVDCSGSIPFLLSCTTQLHGLQLTNNPQVGGPLKPTKKPRNSSAGVN